MSSASPARPSSEYVLGTGSDELDRLAFQARLWADAAHAVWRAAGIEPGARVLDVGCGPGYAAFDLAQLVTRQGRVVGVDESAAFIAHLTEQAAARRLPQLTGVQGDVHEIPAALNSAGEGGGSFDLAYARWVLCFVRDPGAVVAGVAAALKPGGRFAVHDYFNYEAMTPAPRRESYTRLVRATARSWRDRGGDPDVVGRLPRLMREHGIELTHLAVHQRIARPGETMWHWADSWWRIFTPKLVQMGYVTQAEADGAIAELDEMGRDRDGFLVMPPVFEVVGVRK